MIVKELSNILFYSENIEGKKYDLDLKADDNMVCRYINAGNHGSNKSDFGGYEVPPLMSTFSLNWGKN